MSTRGTCSVWLPGLPHFPDVPRLHEAVRTSPFPCSVEERELFPGGRAAEKAHCRHQPLGRGWLWCLCTGPAVCCERAGGQHGCCWRCPGWAAGGRCSEQFPAPLHDGSSLGSQSCKLMTSLVFYFSVLYFLFVSLNVTFHFLCLDTEICGLKYFGRSTKIGSLLLLLDKILTMKN